ncbi:MAG: Gx transporter family protein [Oscillospiraceae bacterium]|nr:Gx transporter family protein [Oscillospiraceae bacterium]
MSARRLARDAIMAAIALILFIIELQIPPLTPIPGVKLGLANIVTVCSMFLFGPLDTLAILLVRILLGSIFAGQMISLLYSLAGGLLCYLVMLLLRKILTWRQIWVCSVIGAVAHNVGQIAVAILITSTPLLITYLPVLLVSGMIAGLITGIIAQLLTPRLAKPLGIKMEDRKKIKSEKKPQDGS